jgi:O-methyltransferase involved in polyketide biosynthesis
MLWALHERACAAKRGDNQFRDPECVRIYDSIDYDFSGNFGMAGSLAAARAARIDQAIRHWLSRFPYGFIVSLGEGLETQAYRVDNGTMRWLSVDLPDAIAWRERFIQPTERFKHLAMSALDERWMDHVDDRRGVCVIAQGLLMYFRPEEVRRLFVEISKRFAGGQMIFDLVARTLSEATEQGHEVTESWTSPVMPWGLNRDEVVSTLRSWHPGLHRIRCTPYRAVNRRPAVVEDILDLVLPHRRRLPSIVEVTF